MTRATQHPVRKTEQACTIWWTDLFYSQVISTFRYAAPRCSAPVPLFLRSMFHNCIRTNFSENSLCAVFAVDLDLEANPVMQKRRSCMDLLVAAEWDQGLIDCVSTIGKCIPRGTFFSCVMQSENVAFWFKSRWLAPLSVRPKALPPLISSPDYSFTTLFRLFPLFLWWLTLAITFITAMWAVFL